MLFLLGPTASGKTALVAELAKRIPCEVVSVDSALVYKGMDIGTAKPDPSLRTRVRHHLIDVCDPSESYSAAKFCADATVAIEAIHKRGRVPVLAGGTMFYFHALEHGLAPMPTAGAALRNSLSARAHREGVQPLYDELTRLDPVAAARIHPKDSQRVQRALEVCLAGDRPFSALQGDRSPPVEGRIYRVGLDFAERARLHKRIARRLDRMLAAGLAGEVSRLMLRGDLDLALPSMRAVGYRQVWKYLCGHYSFDEMRLRVIRATRQLAKKQLTWMRRMPNLHLYCSDRCDYTKIAAQIEKNK